jgi:hypothetical protein
MNWSGLYIPGHAERNGFPFPRTPIRRVPIIPPSLLFPFPFPYEFLTTPFIGRSVHIRQRLRSFFIPLSTYSFSPLLSSRFFFLLRTGRYALSSLGFSFLPHFFPSRHLPISSASSRACGGPPHAVLPFRVLFRGTALLLLSSSLFCRVE